MAGRGIEPEHWKSYTKDVWGARADKSRPWFGQIQIDGGKGDRRYLDDADFIVKDSVSLPPYFPEHSSPSSGMVRSFRECPRIGCAHFRYSTATRG
jgi:hypothetical protein